MKYMISVLQYGRYQYVGTFSQSRKSSIQDVHALATNAPCKVEIEKKM